VIGKEAVFYGAFTLLLVIWSRFVLGTRDRWDFVLLPIAALLCATLRPHYVTVVMWLFVSTVLVNKYKGNAWGRLLPLALLGGVLFFCFAWEPLLYRGFGGIDPAARASRFAVFGIEPRVDAGFEAYKSLLPLGALLGIVGPMPAELLARPVFIPFFLEGLLIFLFPALVYGYACKQSFPEKQRFKHVFWFCLIPALLALIVLHAPFGLLNPGSATRWRVNFEAAFHLGPLLLLYGFMDKARRESHSLSS
jgi:hypothetical protein